MLQKYIDRPSPPFSATLYPGFRKMGNDGNLWESIASRVGIYRWVPVKGTTTGEGMYGYVPKPKKSGSKRSKPVRSKPVSKRSKPVRSRSPKILDIKRSKKLVSKQRQSNIFDLINTSKRNIKRNQNIIKRSHASMRSKKDDKNAIKSLKNVIYRSQNSILRSKKDIKKMQQHK
jgi:hypothetical protein